MTKNILFFRDFDMKLSVFLFCLRKIFRIYIFVFNNGLFELINICQSIDHGKAHTINARNL